MAPIGAIFIGILAANPYPCLKSLTLCLMMNIVILGPGAIGTLWAHALYRAGHAVSVYSRHDVASLSLCLDGESLTFANNQPDRLANADLLLVTLKAPQVCEALLPLRDLVHPDTMIMLMHNGMGNAEQVQTWLPNNPLLLATTTHGALRSDGGSIQHTGQGETFIGAANLRGQACGFLAEVLNHALPTTAWHPDIEQALWLKLAINCAINPLTALEHIRNGELARDDLQAIIAEIVSEVHSVMHAKGYTITQKELLEKINGVIANTARNFSSMHQDIVHKRHSEIDFITGYFLKWAAHYGLATPMNQRLYQEIKQRELSWKDD